MHSAVPQLQHEQPQAHRHIAAHSVAGNYPRKNEVAGVPSGNAGLVSPLIRGLDASLQSLQYARAIGGAGEGGQNAATKRKQWAPKVQRRQRRKHEDGSSSEWDSVSGGGSEEEQGRKGGGSSWGGSSSWGDSSKSARDVQGIAPSAAHGCAGDSAGDSSISMDVQGIAPSAAVAVAHEEETGVVSSKQEEQAPNQHDSTPRHSIRSLCCSASAAGGEGRGGGGVDQQQQQQPAAREAHTL
jgi:hypothetical protein